jgi:hypothetical protein
LNRKRAGPCSCICTHCCSGKRTRDEGDAGKRGEEAGGIGTGPGAALRRIMETNYGDYPKKADSSPCTGVNLPPSRP